MHFATGHFATGYFAAGYFGEPEAAPSGGRHFAPGYFADGHFAPGYFGDADGPGTIPAWDWYRHPNYAETTVVTPRAEGEAGLVVADTSRFVMAGKPIRLTVFDPSGAAVGIYRVTAVNHGASTLTIAEPIEGTVDADIPDGYTVRNVLTGGDIDDIQDALDDIRSYLLGL